MEILILYFHFCSIFTLFIFPTACKRNFLIVLDSCKLTVNLLPLRYAKKAEFSMEDAIPNTFISV